MGLSPSERQALVDALLKVFPSKGALIEMVRYQFGADLDHMARQGDLLTTVHQLVEWAEREGRTAELLRASQQWNPQISAVQEFVGSLSRSTRLDQETVPASPPKISEPLRRALVEALLSIPKIEDFEFRSKLLIGIPWQVNLPRGWSDARGDLETMVDQLGSLGRLSSGAWPLVILADNGRAYARDTRAEVPLNRVYKRLLTFYSAK